MCISDSLNHKIREMTDEYMNYQPLAIQKLLNLMFCLIANPFFFDSVMTPDMHQNIMYMKKQFRAKLQGCEKNIVSRVTFKMLIYIA